MSNGKIDYALGLETSGLLGKLTGVNQAFDLMGRVIDGVGTVARSVFDEIERGASLKDLSNRTGENVRNLFQLQFAFEQSGIAAGNVPGTLLRFQKALSGVGEMGENTAEAFAVLRLNIDELRGLDSPAALEKIFTGLNNLDRNSAADVASRIFGRGSSGDILQLARDSEGFAQSLADAARQAALFERSADAFDKFGDTIGQLKLELRGVFATIAEDITPALQVMLDMLKGRDIEGFGQLLELSLKSGIQGASNFMFDQLDQWGAKIRETLGLIGDQGGQPGFWEKVGKGTLGVGAGLLGVGGLLGGALGIPGAQDKAEERIAQAERLFNESGLGDGIVSKVAEAMAKSPAGARANPFFDELKKFFAERIGPAVAPTSRGTGGLGASNILSSFGSGSAFGDANALERVGASFGGGSSSGLVNAARQTATNTRESAKALYKMNSLLERFTAQDRSFANV